MVSYVEGRMKDKGIRKQCPEHKRDENGEWRRLRGEELYSFYRSPITVRVIKSIRLRWTDHVARMEESRIALNLQEG